MLAIQLTRCMPGITYHHCHLYDPAAICYSVGPMQALILAQMTELQLSTCHQTAGPTCMRHGHEV